MSGETSFFTTGFGAVLALATLGPILVVRAIGGGPTEGLLIAITLLPLVLVVRWVFVDAKRGGRNAWGWAIGVLMFNVLGLAVYIGARELVEPQA